VRQLELVAAHAVVRRQEPPRAALLDGVDGVTRRRLAELVEEAQREAAEHRAEDIELRKKLPKHAERDALA
jgi:hypothetical protein